MIKPRVETPDPHKAIIYGMLLLSSFGLESGRVSPIFVVVSVVMSIWLLHRSAQ